MSQKTEINESKVNALVAALESAGVIAELAKVDDAQQTVNRKWAKIAGLFHKAGMRAEHISGETRSREHHAAVKRAIVLSWPEKHQTLLNLKGAAVAELSDADQGLRAKRQTDIGAYVGLIARHLRKLEGPVERGTKAAKTAEKADTGMRGDTVEGAKTMLRALLAGKAMVCGAATVSKYENCLTEALALLSVKQ